MPNLADIQALADQIVKEFGPRRIILFGSFARGDARPDSDVDLLVEMACPEGAMRRSLALANRLKPRFSTDFVVREPAEVQKRLVWGDPFLKEVFEEGRVLYEE